MSDRVSGAYLDAAKAAILHLEESLAQADASDQWRQMARAVKVGLEQFVDLLGQHRELQPAARSALLRWLEVRYLATVAALDPSVEQALRQFLAERRRTLEHALTAACSLQSKLHVRSWCEQALADPATAEAGGPKDLGHVGRILAEVADACRAQLSRWDDDGIHLAALPADEFRVLDQDYPPT